MSKLIKIRLSSWYWGNYELSTSYLVKKNKWKIGDKLNGYVFEEYIEDEHGWHHSEEFKRDGRPQYKAEL